MINPICCVAVRRRLFLGEASKLRLWPAASVGMSTFDRGRGAQLSSLLDKRCVLLPNCFAAVPRPLTMLQSRGGAVVPSICVFDVNETLLDIEFLALLFQRLFGDGKFLHEWLDSSSCTRKQARSPTKGT